MFFFHSSALIIWVRGVGGGAEYLCLLKMLCKEVHHWWTTGLFRYIYYIAWLAFESILFWAFVIWADLMTASSNNIPQYKADTPGIKFQGDVHNVEEFVDQIFFFVWFMLVSIVFVSQSVWWSPWYNGWQHHNVVYFVQWNVRFIWDYGKSYRAVHTQHCWKQVWVLYMYIYHHWFASCRAL